MAPEMLVSDPACITVCTRTPLLCPPPPPRRPGCQWEKAQAVFEQMQACGCTPDVVSLGLHVRMHRVSLGMGQTW